MASQEAKFSVLVKASPFEVREYAPQVVAQTQVSGDFSEAGKQAFGRLFRYITGHNLTRQKIAMTSPVTQACETTGVNKSEKKGEKNGEKIAMTAPVIQQRESPQQEVQQRESSSQANGGWWVSFIMPAGSQLADMPQPKDASVRLQSLPAQSMAVIRYSGSWSEASYQAHKRKLEAWIKTQGYQASGEAIWARYNPPFTLWFLRRNEVLIPVQKPHSPIMPRE